MRAELHLNMRHLLTAALVPAVAMAQDAHAAIQSSRGVQHKQPLISDDFVVGCIMIMFLFLFAFGARAVYMYHRSRLPQRCASVCRWAQRDAHTALTASASPMLRR